MLVSLYKAIKGMPFDRINAVKLFSTGQTNYARNYYDYISDSNALIWSGNGKTYNIGVNEILEVPEEAMYGQPYGSEPVYASILFSTADPAPAYKFYYINSMERLPHKLRFYLTLDAFATYYERANIAAGSLIVKQSTAKLVDRLIPLTEESTPIPPALLTKTPLLTPGLISLRFLFKMKVQSAKGISTEAYSIIYGAINCADASGKFPSYSDMELLYDHLCNAYEIGASGVVGALAAELEEIYLLPAPWIPVNRQKTNSLFYVDRETATRKSMTYFRVEKTSPTFYPIEHITAAYNKIIIGKNKIELPAYYSEGILPGTKGRIYIEPVYSVTSFDLLLKYETNDPVSIKQYFQMQVSKSTQETSLEKIARIAGYVMTGTNAVQQATIQGGTSIATGNPLGFVAAANTLKGAQDSITANLISVATKSQLPATSYESQAPTVYYDEYGNIRDGLIYQEYYAGEDSQGLLNIKRFGIGWYNSIENLEALLTLPKVAEGARLYVEAEIELSGIPQEAAQELTTLLANGVEVIEG